MNDQNDVMALTIHQIASIIKNLGAQYGPGAVSGTMAAIRIDSIQTILVAALFFAIGLKAFRSLCRVVIKNGSSEVRDLMSLAVMCGLGVSVIITLGGLYKLLSIWDWIGAFKPQLKLAHDLLIKVTQG